MGKKRKELMISVDSFETRAVVSEEGQPVEIYLERSQSPSVVGNVYLARVKDVLPGMQAAFVDIGIGRNAFLHAKEVVLPEEVEVSPKIEQVIKEGQQVLVQIVKEPMGGKGARVTTQLTLPGRYLVLLPFSDFLGLSRRLPEKERERLQKICSALKPNQTGLIVRTAAEGVDERRLKADLKYLQRLWRSLNRRAKKGQAPQLIYKEAELVLKMVRDVFSADFRKLLVDSLSKYKQIISFLNKTEPALKKKVQLYSGKISLFEKYNLEKAVETALKRRVWLRSGGYISIEQTEALTAIDVNTGKYVGKTSLEDTIFKTNLEAAREIVSQLRLRDIGGIIVIDFIDMQNPANRKELFRVFNEALEEDKTKTRVIEISRLGLVEMTRKNVSEGVLDFLYEPCPTCGGIGQSLSSETLTIKVCREIIRQCSSKKEHAFLFKVNPVVYSFLEQHKVYFRGLEREAGRRIYLVSDAQCASQKVELMEAGASRKISALAKKHQAQSH